MAMVRGPASLRVFHGKKLSVSVDPQLQMQRKIGLRPRPENCAGHLRRLARSVPQLEAHAQPDPGLLSSIDKT